MVSFALVVATSDTTGDMTGIQMITEQQIAQATYELKGRLPSVASCGLVSSALSFSQEAASCANVLNTANAPNYALSKCHSWVELRNHLKSSVVV